MNAIRDAHYNLGLAYQESGESDRAVTEFEAAIKLDPGFIDAHCALARAYLDQGDVERAGATVRTALQLDGTHPGALLLRGTLRDVYAERGKAYLDAGRYVEAAADLERGVAFVGDDASGGSGVSDADDVHLHVHLGAAYLGMRSYDKAVAVLERAVSVDSELMDARYYLGCAYVEQGVYDKAVPHLEAAIAMAPHLKHAHYNLGRSHRELGNLEAATNAVTEALRHDPSHQPTTELADAIKQTHYNGGVASLNSGRYSQAVTSFQNAIALDADFVSAHFHIGTAYVKMERYGRAVAALEKAIDLDPSDKAAYHTLALAYLGQQALSKARDAARAALDLDAGYQPALSLLEAIDPNFVPPTVKPVTAAPSSVEVPNVSPVQRRDVAAPIVPAPKSKQETHYDLGTAYLDAKMHTEAIKEFEKAIDLDSGFVAAHVRLAEVYLALGQLDSAEAAADAALGVDRNSDAARQLLETIRRGRPDSGGQRERKSQSKKTPPQAGTPRPSVEAEASDDASDEMSENAEQALHRGQVYLNGKQYNQAAAVFKKVIKMDPDSISAHYGLAEAYLEVGAYNDAQAAVDAVLQLDATHHQAREMVQVIKFARGIERGKKLRKKVLFYTAVIVGIGLFAFGIISFGLLPWIQGGEPRVSVDVALEEPSGNKFLDAGETGRIKLTLTNSGGPARNVQVRFDPPSVAGLKFERPEVIPKVPKGRETVIRVTVTAAKNIKGRAQAMKIQVIGQSGWFGERELLTSARLNFKIIPK